MVSADRRGVEVRIPGTLGKRGRGFMRPGDTGTQRGTDLRKKFPAGQELSVKVVSLERDGSYKVSLRALADDEERSAIRDYRKKSSKQSFGTLGDLFAGKLGKD